jgi:endogenous inhibitor of DNA gyrase (YacG/DUF329 family)
MKPPANASARCAICARPVEPAYKPFCSKRCADVDLGRWLTGSYVIPGEAAGEGDDNPYSLDEES